VTVHLGYEIAAARLHVAVEDSGTGFSCADQDKLFRRFSQVDSSSTRQHGGTGLGLAICKGLVEAMGGSISVESVLGRGSTFSFCIDAPIAGAPIEILADVVASSLGGRRILVVDDNPSNRELASVLLGYAGAEVTLAADGPEALERAGQAAFDALLIDRRMPGMDGMELLHRLRAEPGPNRGAPMLAFTADADRESMTGPGGFDDMILKPIDAAALIEAIARWTRPPQPDQPPVRAAG
jgi:CheY-like chemotaxis protein